MTLLRTSPPSSHANGGWGGGGWSTLTSRCRVRWFCSRVRPRRCLVFLPSGPGLVAVGPPSSAAPSRASASVTPPAPSARISSAPTSSFAVAGPALVTRSLSRTLRPSAVAPLPRTGSSCALAVARLEGRARLTIRVEPLQVRLTCLAGDGRTLALLVFDRLTIQGGAGFVVGAEMDDVVVFAVLLDSDDFGPVLLWE
jgi:hypothetical protein